MRTRLAGTVSMAYIYRYTLAQLDIGIWSLSTSMFFCDLMGPNFLNKSFRVLMLT